MNTVKGLSMVDPSYQWELEIEENINLTVERPLIDNLLDRCSIQGYGKEDPITVVNGHVYNAINQLNGEFCIVAVSGFKKPLDFIKIHRYNGVNGVNGGVNTLYASVSRYSNNAHSIRSVLTSAEDLAENERVFVFITSKYAKSGTPSGCQYLAPVHLTTIEKGEKPFSKALKRAQCSNEPYYQYVALANEVKVKSFKNSIIVGKNSNVILNAATVCPGQKIISSNEILYCQIDNGERVFYAREIRSESPNVKLIKGFIEFIRDAYPELIDECPKFTDRCVFKNGSVTMEFHDLSDEILLRAFEFMDSMVTYCFERQFIKMFPQMNSIQFIDNVVDELNLDRSEIIDAINGAFNCDYGIDFVTGETIIESEATYIVNEGYTMCLDGYVLCVNDDEYHEERSCTYHNGEWYTNYYFYDNFSYCHNCDDYYDDSYGCSCGGESCEDILLPSDDNVLDRCGYIYIDVDKDRETIKPELSFKKKGVRTYGLEIEFASFHEDDRDFVIQETMILKSDGTSGVTGEINTLPFTFNALQDPNALNELWSYLERVTANGGQGDVSQCGIHIHVSRDSVSDLDIAKLECLINSHHEHLALLARRDYFKNSYTNRNMDKNVFVKPREKRMEKYQPVNYQHSKTFEIRIFRSNLRSDRVRACVEFVEFGLAFVKTVSVTDLKTKSFEDLGFLQALNRNSKRFKNLHELAVSKGLLDKKPTAKQA